MLQPLRIWRVNNQTVGNELGARVNPFRVTTCSWQRLASLFLGSRLTTQPYAPNSAHKCSWNGRFGFFAFCFLLFFKLCLNAQYCHEKVLVGTLASLLLMGSCGWQKYKTQKFWSLGPIRPFWLKMITQLFCITRARQGERQMVVFVKPAPSRITQSMVSSVFADLYSHYGLEMVSHFSQGWSLTS